MNYSQINKSAPTKAFKMARFGVNLGILNGSLEEPLTPQQDRET